MGFAFANADFLFEVDADGVLQFVAGAAGDLAREPGESLVGMSVDRLFQPADAVKFSGSLKRLRNGSRAGPYKLKTVRGAEVEVSMFRLAENGANVSCTLSRADTGACDIH